MKLYTLPIYLILTLPLFSIANDWSDEDWGQWVNEDMSDQQFSDEAFDQLNELDGIEPQESTKISNGKQILPNEVLFQLWQLENGLHFSSYDELSNADKVSFTQWVDLSDYILEEIDTQLVIEPIEPPSTITDLTNTSDSITTPSNDQGPTITDPELEEMQVDYQYEIVRPQDIPTDTPSLECDDPNHYHWGDNEFYFHDNVESEDDK